jgi:drug/metabolite transporter (DMT)-like permease
MGGIIRGLFISAFLVELMFRSRLALGFAAAAGAAALWAISGVFGKILMRAAVSPSQLVFYRSALGSALLGAILLPRSKTLFKVSLRDLPLLIALGVLGLALTQFFYYAAIRSMSVGLAILLEYLAPLWIILFERLWRKKPIARAKILALILALSGCFLVSLPAGSGAQLSPKGLFFGMAAGVCFAGYGLMSQKALESYPETTVLFYSLFFTALFWGVFASGIKASLLAIGHLQLGMILYVTVLGTLLPFFLFIFALKRLEASQVGIVSTLEPVLAAVIAWFHLGERLTLMQMIGGFLVLSAIVLLQTLQPKLNK